MSKTVIFQTIQFSVITEFSSIWPYRTLSSTTTPGQNGPGSDSSEEEQRILPNSIITEGSSSDYLVSYPGHLPGKPYSLCRDAVTVFYSPCWLGQKWGKELSKDFVK